MRIQSKSKKVSKVVEANEATRKFGARWSRRGVAGAETGPRRRSTASAEGEGFQARTKKFVKTANNDARKFTAGVRKQVGLHQPAACQGAQERDDCRKCNRRTRRRRARPLRGAVQGRCPGTAARVAELNREIKGGARRAAR